MALEAIERRRPSRTIAASASGRLPAGEPRDPHRSERGLRAPWRHQAARGRPAAPHPHIQRPRPAVADVRALKADDERAKLGAFEPERHLALEHAALRVSIAAGRAPLPVMTSTTRAPSCWARRRKCASATCASACVMPCRSMRPSIAPNRAPSSASCAGRAARAAAARAFPRRGGGGAALAFCAAASRAAEAQPRLGLSPPWPSPCAAAAA